jgi:hypothetical protein
MTSNEWLHQISLSKGSITESTKKARFVNVLCQQMGRQVVMKTVWIGMSQGRGNT